MPPALRSRLATRLATLDADAVWLFFVPFVPPAERWPSRPPNGCARPDPTTLLQPLAGATEGVVAPALARSALEAVSRADRHVAKRALSEDNLPETFGGKCAVTV